MAQPEAGRAPGRNKVLPENGVMQRGHMENNLNNFYNKIQRFAGTSPLRGPCRHKACCNGNNYEQRFALDTFPADFSWRNVLAKRCILLFTLQQDVNARFNIIKYKYVKEIYFCLILLAKKLVLSILMSPTASP